MTYPRLALLIAFIAFTNSSELAQADEFQLAPKVRLQVDSSSCHSEQLDIDAFVALLRVELTAKENSNDPVLSLVLKHCENRLSKVLLEVVMPGDNRSKQQVDLSSITNSAQPRALALIFMDLVRSTPTQDQASDMPHEPTAKSTAPNPAPPALGHLVYRYYERWGTSVAGFAASMVRGPFRLGAITTVGGYSDPLGTTMLGTAALSGSVQLIARPPFHARLGTEAGVAWAHGLSSSVMTVGHSVMSPHFAAHLELGVVLYTSSNIHIEVGMVGGLASGLIAKSGSRSLGGIAGPYGGGLMTLHLPF